MKYTSSFYNIVIEEDKNNVFLYNSYSGALIKLERSVYEIINKVHIDDHALCPYFDELFKQGFLKPANLNEYNRILTNERRAVYDNTAKKLTFVIAPTLQCNLNCEYCFEEDIRCNKTMSEITWEETISFLNKYIKPETQNVHITWFGGEPLLEVDKILKFSESFIPNMENRNIKFTSSITTNGTLLTKEKLHILIEKCNLRRVQITMDGTEENYRRKKGATKSQYLSVLDNIKYVAQYIPISIRLNCDKGNFEDIKILTKEILNLCSFNKNINFYLAKLVNYNPLESNDVFYTQEAFDIKNIEFQKYVLTLEGRDFKPKLPKYRRNFCGLFKLKNLAVGPDGELYKCEHWIGRKEKIIGTVNDGIYYTDEMIDSLDSPMNEKCKKCKTFPLCIGGCPAQRKDLLNEESCFFSEEYVKQLVKAYIVK